MQEMKAVVGYLPDAAAKALASGKQSNEPIEVRLERGSDDAHVRINPKDITGVLLGASQKGETGVQLFLSDKAQVDSVTRGLASNLGLRLIKDLTFYPWRPPINVIYINPPFLKDLMAKQLADLKSHG